MSDNKDDVRFAVGFIENGLITAISTKNWDRLEHIYIQQGEVCIDNDTVFIEFIKKHVGSFEPNLTPKTFRETCLSFIKKVNLTTIFVYIMEVETGAIYCGEPTDAGLRIAGHAKHNDPADILYD